MKRRVFSAAALLSAGLLAGLATSRPAEASIVERVVAVVGERPILLSELRARARPYIYRIAMTTQNPTQQAAAESEAFREVLKRMIDDRLEEQAADKAHLTVTPDEVDNAIRTVATQNKLDPKDLLAEAKRTGLSEQDYRDEMRRQILEEKLIQLRVRGRVRVTDVEARAAYDRVVKQLAQEQRVELRLLVLRVPPGASDQQIAARRTLAEELGSRGRGGEDWCNLVLSYSEDASTKNTCGSSGPHPLSQLAPELQQIATTLKPGEISDPVMFKDPLGQQAILVVQVASSPGAAKIPPYEQVRDQMMGRAYQEATERQKTLWLQELRRGIYIDVRL